MKNLTEDTKLTNEQLVEELKAMRIWLLWLWREQEIENHPLLRGRLQVLTHFGFILLDTERALKRGVRSEIS